MVTSLTESDLHRYGFELRVSKRKTFQRGPLVICPPCGELGWYFGLTTVPALQIPQYTHPIKPIPDALALLTLLELIRA